MTRIGKASNLTTAKPAGRRPTTTTEQQQAQIVAEGDPVKRLELIQRRLDLEDRLGGEQDRRTSRPWKQRSSRSPATTRPARQGDHLHLLPRTRRHRLGPQASRHPPHPPHQLTAHPDFRVRANVPDLMVLAVSSRPTLELRPTVPPRLTP
jgi:hypothetical protein